MASARERIMQAALAKLNTGAPAGLPPASRARPEPFTLEELPALTLKPVREEVEYETEGKRSYFRRRILTLRVSTYAVGDDSALDPVLTWVTSQLDGIVFLELVEDCQEALNEWEYAAEDQPYLVCHQDFRIHYHTIVGDQTRTQ